jgi:hypothetical protein
VAELADAHGSGPCTRKGVGVRVPSSAPRLAHSQQHLGSRNAFLTFTNLLCRFYKFFMPSTISIVDGFYCIYGDHSWDLRHCRRVHVLLPSRPDSRLQRTPYEIAVRRGSEALTWSSPLTLWPRLNVSQQITALPAPLAREKTRTTARHKRPWFRLQSVTARRTRRPASTNLPPPIPLPRKHSAPGS